ncbi:DUF3375 domain-containing protein [Amycolatopsis thermalba]|uniref:DUF3375 domain-containing protein n=1 Tax=Amycolatopsis thermalba TaxID=944492 RepID=A0ABY4NYN9_9PSEU|nr:MULTISPECIES: DUF3375 domain-containing protein [Amycolatopsis]UQS25185.1 DUF3375 domain-containing protein [Amycolatopsis thermalba]
MSRVLGELTRAQDALARPTLRLLDGKWAAFRVAVFRCSFSRDRRSVQTDVLHTQIDTYLTELQRDGIDVPPSMNGRALCNLWVNDQWLFRDNAADDSLVYSLTSSALEALDLVQNLSRDRVLVSESRLTTILDTVRRWALEASPDAQARIERLNSQIRELEAERDRLETGGDAATASDERMLDGYTNLIDLIGQLPSDFKRVEESVLDMHRKILRDFRDEDRPVIDVLDEYLARQDELVKETPEGRAFDGAFVLLRDDALLLELRENVQALLAHPAAEVLDTRDVSEIRGAVTIIRQGMKDVLAQRRRLTATLKEHIVNRDVLQERELDRVLRGIERELAKWMETAGPRATVPVELLPPVAKVGHLRTRLWDPASAEPPPPLERVDDDGLEPPTVEELRMQGGPSLDELRAALIDAFTTGNSDTVGHLFNELPKRLRRPVEVLGLLHLVSRIDAMSDDDETEVFEAIRPNGDRRHFLVPRMSLTPTEAAALAGLTLNGSAGE